MARQAKVYRLTEIRQNRKPREQKDPFVIEVAEGVRATFADPRGLSLREMVELEEAGIRTALTKLIGSDLTAELLKLDDFGMDDFSDVMKAWREHYDLGAQGDSGASSN